MDVRKQAQELWVQRVTRGENPLICSAEGFYQHIGECANDSIQMILCFCDSIKETTQHALLFSPLAELELQYPGLRKPNQMRTYIDILRRRFARHYMNDYSICELEEPVGPLRAAGKNAITAAIAATLDPKKVTKNIYIERKLAGMHGDMIAPLFNQLLGVFQLTKVITPVAAVDISPHIPNTIDWSGAMVGCILANANTSGDGHVLAYYKCGGYDFVYDNNTGPIYFPWSLMFREIQTLLDEEMTEVRLHHVNLHFQIKSKKKSTRSYYPVYEVRGASKDPHKSTYYTYIPHTHTLITLRYADAETGYTSEWVDGNILWFYDNTKIDTENQFLTFMVVPIFSKVTVVVNAMRMPTYARPGEANIFRTEKPVLGPVYEGAAAAAPPLMANGMGAVEFELPPYESPPKERNRGTKRNRSQLNTMTTKVPISRWNIDMAQRTGVTQQKKPYKPQDGGARKTRRRRA